MSVVMKPSGVQWIGDIPEHWKIMRIKDIVDLKSGDSITSDNIAESGDYQVYGGNGLRGFTNGWTHEGEYALIGRQGALCGNINYASGKFWASEHAVVANPIKSLNTFWLGELLRTMNLNQYSNAAAQPGLSLDNIKYLYIPVPVYKEQQSIANFLDKATLQIDNAIKTKQTQLETLATLKKSIIHKAVTKGLDDSVAMKDSGIEWIGEIPEHWKIVRVKDDLEFFTGKTPNTTNSEYYFGSNKWITISDLGEIYITDTKQCISDEYIEESKIKIAPKGSLIFSFKLTVGTVAIIDEPMYTNEAIAIFTPNIKTNTKFLYYSFGLYLKENAKTNIYGAALMNRDIIKASKYLMPPKKEQEAIVDFLDREVEKINTLKSNVKNQINKLKEYRKSLIYEYVTGKKQVKV